MQSRRRFLQSTGLLFGAAGGGFAYGALGHVNERRGVALADEHKVALVDAVDPTPVTRIAFGSCAHQDKPQPIWQAIIAAEPELFLFLGDNVYADTRDITEMREQYAK